MLLSVSANRGLAAPIPAGGGGVGGGVEGGGCLCAYMGLFPGSLDVQADKWLGCGWQLRLEMHFESRLTQGCSQGVAMPH